MFAAVAAAGSTSSFKLSLDGKDITEEIAVPAASSGEDNYDDYNKVKSNVTLPAGEHVLRFTVVGSWLDIDYFTFVKGKDATDPEPIGPTNLVNRGVMLDMYKARDAQYFDLQGHRLEKSAIKKAGVYLVKIPGFGTRLVRVEKSR